MPVHEDNIFRKPSDEPFRRWNLEECVYCESQMDLQDKRCRQCGHQRSVEDANMADRIEEYRRSTHGQQQYQILAEHEKSQDRSLRWFVFFAMFVMIWPLAWIAGSMIWGNGVLFAWIASLTLSTLVIWKK